MDDLTKNCALCHEQLRTPSQHTCGRNPEGGLPASQPHKQQDAPPATFNDLLHRAMTRAIDRGVYLGTLDEQEPA